MPPVILGRGRSATEPRVEAAAPAQWERFENVFGDTLTKSSDASTRETHQMPPLGQAPSTVDDEWEPFERAPVPAPSDVASEPFMSLAAEPSQLHGASRTRTASPNQLVTEELQRNAPIEGTLYQLQRTAFVLKRWKPRFARLSAEGVLSVWADAGARMKGDQPIGVHILSSATMAMTPLQTTSTGPYSTVFHRSIVELGSHAEAAHLPRVDFVLKDSEVKASGATIVLSFGCDSAQEFERWTRHVRAVLSRAHQAAFENAGDGGLSPVASAPLNAADLFLDSIVSPRQRRRRRSTSGGIRVQPLVASSGASGSTGDVIFTSVRLLDGTALPLSLPQGATVKDALLSIRGDVGLRADSDFSLFLATRHPDTGRDDFVALPDVLPLHEAVNLALPAHRSLVYKRRMRVSTAPSDAGAASASDKPPLPGSAAGIRTPDSPGCVAADFDTEVLRATSPADGAHRLAYAEVAYHVRNGDYLLPLADALVMAGLILIGNTASGNTAATSATMSTGAGGAFKRPNNSQGQSEPGSAGPTGTGAATAAASMPQDASFYERVLPQVLAAQNVAEHKATTGGSYGDLARAVHSEHHRLCGLFSPFEARRVALKRVAGLPEYGAAFFTATLRRSTSGSGAGAHGSESGGASRTASEAPAWAASAAPGKGLTVLVAISGRGVLTRPLPPHYQCGGDGQPLRPAYRSSLDEPSRVLHPRDSAGPSPSERLSVDGRPIGWHLHGMAAIETWGTADLPAGGHALTYSARERGGLVRVELRSHQAREMSAALHANVYAQLAQREGQRRSHARTAGTDMGSLASAVKLAMEEARGLAREQLAASARNRGGAAQGDEQSLVMLQDSVTGETAWWHPGLRRAVFSRKV